MSRFVATSTALAVIMTSGFLHGRLTARWGESRAVETAVQRLTRVPSQIGDWHAEDLQLDSKHIRQAGLAGAWMRLYTHSRTGVNVTVLLMCGQSGPVAAHPPEVCYGGAGFEMIGRPERISLESQASRPVDQFWTARFKKQSPDLPESLRIYWAWNADGTWCAADYPRLSFAQFPVLYKLYVVRSLPPGQELAGNDPSLEFLRVFLPVVRSVLSSPDA
jgi:hypothetical protein